MHVYCVKWDWIVVLKNFVVFLVEIFVVTDRLLTFLT